MKTQIDKLLENTGLKLPENLSNDYENLMRLIAENSDNKFDDEIKQLDEQISASFNSYYSTENLIEKKDADIAKQDNDVSNKEILKKLNAEISEKDNFIRFLENSEVIKASDFRKFNIPEEIWKNGKTEFEYIGFKFTKMQIIDNIFNIWNVSKIE